MTATATIAAIGNGSAFNKGRGFAAWLGVVPGEHSTGGKQTLTDTKRRENWYLRKLFVQGAHAVLQQRMKQSNGLNTWLAQLTSRKRIQMAAVALAKKKARMVWAVLSKGEAYRPPLLLETAAVRNNWPAVDAWQKPGLEIAFAIPTITDRRRLRRNVWFSCQVCWRTMTMAQRSNPAPLKPVIRNRLKSLRY
jgi:hypothetical protein